MTDDVFAADQPETNDNAPAHDAPHADLLKEIVNEEGVQKYRSIEDALEGLKNSQEFIAKLKQENQTFRSELDKRMSAEAILHELKQRQKPDEQPSSSVDPEAIEQLVDKRLEARTEEQKATANEDLVQGLFRESFGERAKDVVRAKAEALGMSPEDIRVLSRKAPEAVLKMFDLASQPKATAPSRPTSSVRTEALRSENPSVRTYRWWQDLRRNSPQEYRNRYMEYMKDASNPGFFD